MERIIIILGLLYFIDAMFDKFFIWRKMEEVSRFAPNRFVYKLMNCRFCLMFHMTWIITVIYGTATSFEMKLLLVPFVVIGLSRLKEKI